jgi:hypothetical protein
MGAALTEKDKALLVRLGKIPGHALFVSGSEVTTARRLQRFGLATLQDDGAFGPDRRGSNADGERWTAELTGYGLASAKALTAEIEPEPTITRALLEHLARYRRVDPGKHADILSVLRAHDDGGTVYDFGARLGMYAAAELLLGSARALRDASPGDVVDVADAWTAAAKEILRRAGIDDARWELARG